MPKEQNKNQGKENKQFMKDFKSELKRVSWPEPKKLLNGTLAVITIVVIVAIIVFALDFAFEKMNTYGIEKIKSIVDTTNTVTNDVDNTNTEASSNEVTEDEANNTAENTTSDDNNTNETSNTVDE